MRERIKKAAPFVIGLVLFVAALEVLRVELSAFTWRDLSADVWHTPPGRLFLAVVLTALNYATLTGYDLLAFAYIGTRLRRAHIAGASFLAYAISNNVGFGVVSGASVRYRFYTRWGVTAEDLSRIVFSYSVTFWLGLLALGGLSLVAAPIPDITGVPARAVLVAVGWVLMAVPPAYVALTLLRREPFRFRQFVLPLPRPAIAVAQLAISCADWLLMGAVLYVLLPDHGPPFFAFLASFLVAILLGMVSHVPGGLGVFEGLMVLMLRPYLSSAELLPPLVVFRAVYYLLPFTIGLAGLLADEMRQRRALIARTGALLVPRGRDLDTTRPRRIDVPLRCRAALFGGHSGGGGPALRPRPGAAARRHRDVALHGERGGSGAAHPFARAVAPARCRLLCDSGHASRRHRGVAAQGIRLRGSVPARNHARGPAACPRRLRLKGRVLRHAILDALAGGHRGRARRLHLAGILRLQARQLFTRLVVAVRTGRRGVPLPARIGRRRADAVAGSRGPADVGGATGDRDPFGSGPRRRRARHSVPIRDVTLPVPARRQGPALRRHARRVRDVRRPGAHLGRLGRPGVRAGATV